MLKKLSLETEKLINKYKYKFELRKIERVEFQHENLLKEGYYSQYGQDKWIVENIFPNKENGIFVDIGAHDGITFSNTYFLEKLGWHGVAIEPIQEIYEKLVKNRSCLAVNGCISSHTGKESFRAISGKSEMLSGIVSEYDANHLKRIRNEVGIKENSFCDIEVQSYNLNDLLEELKLTTIDYVNIDTEGAEYTILKSINFNKNPISVLSVENNYSDYRIPKLMEQNGFKLCAKIGDDDIYKNTEALRTDK